MRFSIQYATGVKGGKMADYEFELPYPPSVGAMWRSIGHRFILSAKGRKYREDAISHIKKIGLFDEGLNQRLSVHMTINPPTLRKYDIDNKCKAPFDALTHAGFWLDDEQVDRLTIIKGEKTRGGNIFLKVELIGERA